MYEAPRVMKDGYWMAWHEGSVTKMIQLHRLELTEGKLITYNHE